MTLPVDGLHSPEAHDSIFAEPKRSPLLGLAILPLIHMIVLGIRPRAQRALCAPIPQTAALAVSPVSVLAGATTKPAFSFARFEARRVSVGIMVGLGVSTRLEGSRRRRRWCPPMTGLLLRRGSLGFLMVIFHFRQCSCLVRRRAGRDFRTRRDLHQLCVPVPFPSSGVLAPRIRVTFSIVPFVVVVDPATPVAAGDRRVGFCALGG